MSIILTFMNSLYHLNYQMTGKYLRSKTMFSKKVNLMKYPVRHTCWWRPGIYYLCIFLAYSNRPWNLYTKWKTSKQTNKTSNLIKVISSYNICSGNKLQQIQKQPFVIQYQKLLFFLELFCSISLTHFLPSNFMCALNR